MGVSDKSGNGLGRLTTPKDGYPLLLFPGFSEPNKGRMCKSRNHSQMASIKWQPNKSPFWVALKVFHGPRSFCLNDRKGLPKFPPFDKQCSS